MNIDDLLLDGRKIWGDQKLTLDEIIICLNVAIGDLSRVARAQAEGKACKEAELKKELGNILFSVIRWCDDLGYKPEDCIAIAQSAQVSYAKKLQADG